MAVAHRYNFRNIAGNSIERRDPGTGCRNRNQFALSLGSKHMRGFDAFSGRVTVSFPAFILSRWAAAARLITTNSHSPCGWSSWFA